MDKFKMRRLHAALIVSGLAFLIGLIFVTQGGLFWLDTVDHYINNFGLVLVGLFTCILVGWVYGAHKIREYINSVSEVRIGAWFDICIKYITPIILIITLGFNIHDRITEPYEGYPQWVQNVGGWAVVGFIIVAGIVLMLIKRKNSEDVEEGEVE